MRDDYENDIDFRSWSSLIDAWEREDRGAERRVAAAERIMSHVRETGVTEKQRMREASRRGHANAHIVIAAKRAARG